MVIFFKLWKYTRDGVDYIQLKNEGFCCRSFYAKNKTKTNRSPSKEMLNSYIKLSREDKLLQQLWFLYQSDALKHSCMWCIRYESINAVKENNYGETIYYYF